MHFWKLQYRDTLPLPYKLDIAGLLLWNWGYSVTLALSIWLDSQLFWDLQNLRFGERKWEARSHIHRHITSHLKLACWPPDLTSLAFSGTFHYLLCSIQLLLWSITTLCFFNGVLLSRWVTTLFDIYYIYFFISSYNFHHFFLYSPLTPHHIFLAAGSLDLPRNAFNAM